MTSPSTAAVRIEPDRDRLFDEIQPYYKKIEDVQHCMQCGTCTGGCPTAGLMEYTPRQMMYMCQLGLLDELLASRSIWACVNCYTCSVRCPRDIKVSEVLDALRALALRKGTIPRAEAVYHHSFTRVMERYGRVFEGELMMRYAFLNNPLMLVKEGPLGLQMMKRGRLHLMPHKVKGMAGFGARFHK